MNYKNFKTPFLNNFLIKNHADLFRKKYADNSLPVDIENVIDIKLKLDIIPINDLMKLCDTDALITSNWKSIYVDKEKFLDDRYENRLRFSLAHETGHFILHKSIYEDFKIKKLEDFYELMARISVEQYSYLETQANKFANYLLIPRDKLTYHKNKIIRKISNELCRKSDAKTFNSYIAIPLSKIFGVSEDAMEIALNDVKV